MTRGITVTAVAVSDRIQVKLYTDGGRNSREDTEDNARNVSRVKLCTCTVFTILSLRFLALMNSRSARLT